MMSTPQIAALLPRDPALSSHCRRVAALGHLIAHHLFLPTEEKELLNVACLLHHADVGGFAPPALNRLLADIWGGQKPAVEAVDPLPGEIRAIVNASRAPRAGSGLDRKLGEMLRFCDVLDQELEIRPIEQRDPDEILEHLTGATQSGLWSQELTEALGVCMAPLPLGEPDAWALPPFPQAAVRMLNLLRDPLASLGHVVQAAGTDPAAAGAIMQLANSALFGKSHPAATLYEAISRLGFATAHRVLTAVALRPVLYGQRLEKLWPHSLDVADLAEQLAGRSSSVEPGEAYLAGLLHDVGQIALLSVPLYDSARLKGLEASECPAVYAEDLLLRTNHAELGAQIARIWRLPENIVEAIRHHHTPEATENRLAHVLYLAEYLSDSEEDLPSQFRMRAALRGLGMTLEEVNGCLVSDLGTWLAAA